MDCSTFVMAWEDCLESHDSVVICALDTSQEGRVPAVVCDVAGLVDARVDASGIAVPDVDVQRGDSEAGVDV